MLQRLLFVTIYLTLTLASFAETANAIPGKPTQQRVFSVSDDFESSDLFNYIYALSTPDSHFTVRDILDHKSDLRPVPEQIPHFGSDNRYHWMSTVIRNTGSRPAQLASYMHFNEMTDLCFYVVNGENQVVYRQEHFSQRTPISQKPIQTRYFAFPVDVPVGEEVTVFWRVFRAENSVVTPIWLHTRDSLHSFLRFYDSFAFLCLGVIISAFLLSFILFLVTRKKILFHYAGYCLFYFLICITNDGIALQYFHIDPFKIALGTRLVVTGFMMYFLYQFSMLFLNASKLFSPLFIDINNYISYILPILAATIAVFALDERFSFLFYLASIMVMFSITAMVITGMLHKKRAAFIYFIAAGPFFASCIWYGLIILFDIQATWFFYITNLAIPIIEMLVLGGELGNKLIKERDKYFSGIHKLQRELTASILKTQEMERRRIAADLHDELGGTLATLRLKFATMKRSLSQNKSPEKPALQIVESIESLIHQSSHDLRHISQRLMPPEFDRIGLIGSVEHMVRSTTGKTAQFAFLTAGQPRSFSVEQELAVYRICADILQNIAKRELVLRGSLQILFLDKDFRIVVEADEPIADVGETEKSIQKTLAFSSLLTTHLNGSFIMELSYSGIFIIIEIPY